MTALHVAFQVGGGEYVLPASDVLHMESYEADATEVPGTAPWVQGLVQVRGRVVPLVDLRRRFGLPPPAGDERASPRIIVVEHRSRVAGLLADSAREVIKLDPTIFRDPPEALREGKERFIRAIAIHADRMLMLLDLAKVLGEVNNDDEQR